MYSKRLFATAISLCSLIAFIAIVTLSLQKNSDVERKGEERDRGFLASPPSRVDWASFDTFAQWENGYRAASNDERGAMLEEGVALALERREAFKALIQEDPESALESAITPSERENLPEEIVQLLEVPVLMTGDFEVIATCGFEEGQKSSLDHYAVDSREGTRYRAYPYGRRLGVTTKRSISLQGVAVDGLLALEEDPIQAPPPEELAFAGLPANSVIVGGMAYVETEPGAIEGLRDGLIGDELTLGPNHIGVYRALRSGAVPGVQSLELLADGSAVPPEDGPVDEPPVAASPHTEGSKTMLYIRARFPDQDPTFEPISLATLQPRQAGCEDFWADNSYGKSSLTTTFTDTVTLADPTSAWPQGLGTLLAQARDAALAAQPAGEDWNYNNYDFYTVVTSGGGFGYGGVAYVGGRGSHLNGGGATNIRTASHEFGHNLGLLHANYWRTDSPSPIGRDSVPGGYRGDTSNAEWIEYGHKFSVMSAQNGGGDFDSGRGHYSSGEKVRLDWLVEGDGDHVTLTNSSTVRLYRHDLGESDFASRLLGVNRSIKIDLPTSDYTTNNRRYWISHRWLPTNGIAESWLRRGVQIDWQRPTYGGDGSVLLDMTPFSRNSTTVGGNWTTDNNDKEDSALLIGRTYSDVGADIHITPTAQGGSSPNQWVDVVVNIGTQGSNTAPQIQSFTANSVEVGTNVTVNFAVSATDADSGDTLAYAWNFDDNSVVTSALNSTTASKSWSSAGQYVVQVTVSDMKGGIDTRDIVVTVGNPSNRYQITGRVLHGGLPVKGARVNIGNNYQAWTEGDGTYTLAGLPLGNHTVTAAKLGLTFTPQFANPVSLSSLNAFGIDFHANEGLSGGNLTMVVSPYEIEVPAGASVQFNAQAWDGTGTEVTPSPSWAVSGGGTIAPDGLFSATTPGIFTVTATDGSAMATASVTVLDINAVGIVPIDSMASESGDTGQLRIRRYGTASDAIDVSLSLGGSATAGSDYVSPGSPVAFAAGQTEALVNIVPLNDFVVENTETVQVGLVAGSGFEVLGSEASATVTITDDGDQGPDVTITSPTGSLIVVPQGVGLVLEGNATDDGLPDPPGSLSASWSMVAGPAGGSVLFSPANAFQTVARFSAPGSYTVALQASDGPNLSSAEIDVIAGVETMSNPSSLNEVIYYTFEDGAGTTVTDVRGGDNNGSLSGGASWSAVGEGISGRAISLDGNDDQVNIDNSNDINLTTHALRTIAFWFKAVDPSKSTKQVLYEEGGGSRGLNVYLQSNTLYFGGWNNNENGWNQTFLSTPFSDTGWHHVALVLNAPGSGLQSNAFIGYLDGERIVSGNGAALNAHSANIAIGAMRSDSRFHDGNGSGTNFRFEGMVDEFHLWNRALDDFEIVQLYAWNTAFPEIDLTSVDLTRQSVVIPGGVGLLLDGSVTGDPAPTVSWSTITAPPSGVATLTSPNTASSGVTFSDPGYYQLRMTADSGAFALALDVHAHTGIDTASNPSTTNQVIYYSLDETTGTTVVDAVGGNHNGTLSGGPTWSPTGGVTGGAIQFDGSDDHIQINDSSDINTGSTVTRRTIALWFNATDPGATGKEVLYEEGGATRGLALYLDGGQLYVGGWNGNVNGWNETYHSIPVDAGKWHHAVLVLDVPSSGALVPDGFKAYLDGALFGVGEGALMTSHSGNIAIGARWDSSQFHDGDAGGDGDHFSGLIDEFHLFNNRVLTIDEIGQLYAHGNIGPLVEAGPNQPGVTGLVADLAGSSIDDGRWVGSVTHVWSVTSGPGTVGFSDTDANGIERVATASVAGTYQLRLAASDGQVTTYDTVSVTIAESTNPQYDTWTQDYPSLTVTDVGGNPDGDTLSNLEEYAFGANPTSNDDDESLLPSSEIMETGGQNYLEFSYRRRRDAVARGLTYTVQFSDNMHSENWSSNGVTETGVNTIDGNFELVTVRVGTPLGDGMERGFIRLTIALSE